MTGLATATEGDWRVGEENVGGGFNIYVGPLRVAHTAILARVSTPGTRPISEAEAKANAALIVEAVNALRALQDPAAVHLNMLRGSIATPTLRQMLHLHGTDALMRWDRAPKASGATRETNAFDDMLQALKTVAAVMPEAAPLVRKAIAKATEHIA